jgi:hypothetical protein
LFYKLKKYEEAIYKNDGAFVFCADFLKNYTGKYASLYNTFLNKNVELGKAYMKGIMETNPEAIKKMYTDASNSMHVSNGNVKSYRPKDDAFYDYVCTAKGILEKYLPCDYEFDLPAKQVELIKKNDFGQYIDKAKNDLVVSFITTMILQVATVAALC